MATIAELSPKLGDEVTFPSEKYGGSTATIVAIDHNDKRHPYVVGWKSLEDYLPQSLTSNNPRSLGNCSIIANYETEFVSSTWVACDAIVTKVSPRRGMKCAGKHCGVYNEWAEPNQPDGKTFYCYPCMQRPSYMR